ncbi:MAG: NADP-dependent malic enzyme [Deltaproteobacteria bacterium]|nr:NADP-dependent malic enzyme [Deltaproteobacteria bacterium]
MRRKKEALEYHSRGRKGKIQVVSTKPCETQRDLSLAYSPGVAEPCLEIQRVPSKAYTYTAKGNLVAVVTNGTAVLGLGNIGPLAAKPVMEGKGVLFKKFADIDVFDIELNALDPKEVVRAVQALEPTFGGINLEDIRSPDCFYIEEELRKTMKIPVFHDDQHGTAIITGAALLNATHLTKKNIKKIKIVFNGAGASAISCANFFVSLGVMKKNITMIDTAGVIYQGRTERMNSYKEQFAQKTKLRTLEEALKKADVFVGLSAKGALKKAWVKNMAQNPIIFALANPDPEITPQEVQSVRKDAIIATGRSDYPNQVNNVLGFPFIFRGALDVGAQTVNEKMKIAAAKALSSLAREAVPESVRKVYGNISIKFGSDYIIPKPFDYRALLWVAPAVAKAAMETGVARKPIKDLEAYRQSLDKLLGRSRGFMRDVINKARGGVGHLPIKKQNDLKRIVLPEGHNKKVIRAAQIIIEEGIATPVLLGKKEIIQKIEKENHYDLRKAEIIFPPNHPKLQSYIEKYYQLRKRKGMTLEKAEHTMLTSPIHVGCMMVREGSADGLVSGVTTSYPETIRPALEIVGMKKEVHVVAGLFVVLTEKGVFFFADTTVNIEPTSEQLAEIAISTANRVHSFDVEPRIAMLSFSNFGSAKHPLVDKVKKAVDIVRSKKPNIVVDGEIQADVAVLPELINMSFSFSELRNGANVLIFPDLQSGNISYKLMKSIGQAEVVGPILLGMKKPVHVLQHNCSVTDIVNMTAITVVEAKDK